MCKRAESLHFLHKTSTLVQLQFSWSALAGELTSAGVPALPQSWVLPTVLWPSSVLGKIQGTSSSEYKLDIDVYEGGHSLSAVLVPFFLPDPPFFFLNLA